MLKDMLKFMLGVVPPAIVAYVLFMLAVQAIGQHLVG